MTKPRAVQLGILVAALGYLVDVYDLVLFNVVRKPSLLGLGIDPNDVLTTGAYLLNIQNIGMLLGGLLWGMLGDKRGRIAVLFGSILLYSVANIANGFVTTVDGYAFWRFFAGVGLSGELGAGITLVSEMMPKEKRGYGTTIVASVGMIGAILAGIIGDLCDWRVVYWIGGGMGLLLLGLRFAMHESGLFASLETQPIVRGSLRMLFGNLSRIKRYICSVLVGIPVYVALGILITPGPEIAAALTVQGVPTGAKLILYFYIGLALGDLSSGLLSQYAKSRRRILAIFVCIFMASAARYLTLTGASLDEFYGACALLGFSVGYWAVLVTTAAEQFGTNLRATVTTTVPNVIRGSIVILNWIFLGLKGPLGIIESAAAVSVFFFLVALLAVRPLSESFGRDLDFVER